MKLVNIIAVGFLTSANLLCLSVVQAANNGTPASSAIPERREFPVDRQVDPCNDFHAYACGPVERSFKLRDDRSSHTFAFNDSAERLLEKKMSFFKNIQTEAKLGPRELQFKNFYLACMNEATGASDETRALKNMLTELNSVTNARAFVASQIRGLKNGSGSLIDFDSGSNMTDPTIHDIALMIKLMNLPEHSYYENAELMAEYQRLIVDFFRIFSPGLAEEKYVARANNLINLEREFVKIYPLPEQERDLWNEKKEESISEFQARYPNLPVAELMKRVPQHLKVTNPLGMVLDFVNKKMTDQNLSTFKDFFAYAQGSALIDESHPEFFAKKFAFSHKYLGGPKSRPARQERCTKMAMKTFKMEVDSFLIGRIFPNFPEKKVEQIAEAIRQSIIGGLQENTWLSPAAREEAIQKITVAKLFLVKPKNAQEWNFRPIRQYSQTNKLDNLALLAKTDLEKKLSELKGPVNQVAWQMGPLTVNAYYSPSANSFVLPIGILQYPFFNPDGSLAENLGGLGAVFAHELGHGIDDQGSKFDSNGSLNQWLSDSDLSYFAAKKEMIRAQFDKIGHNGKLTMGENIADLVGLTFAYRAAFPNNDGTLEDKKALFLSWARVWCDVSLPKQIELSLKSDPHALGWARINEQVKHQKGFAEAYQCPANSPMSLPDQERLKVW
ncbi:MAG: M13 family metallopeptidase [Bdellovibrionales bacterium]|nr:M13 family metallopeptidase [Bdellovibrionales bacterium]